MSWIFSKVLMDSLNLPCSQELVEESLPQKDLESEPSVQLSVSTTQHPFLHNGKIQETSNLSRFGLTSRALTEKHGEELILSLAASHAKIYQLRASKQESQEKGQGFGLRWQESLQKSNQDLFSSKTYQPSENTLDISCTTLPPSGTMRNGAVSAQKKLGDCIKEIECGSLEGKPDNKNFFHTPNTSGLDGGSNSRRALKKRLENFPTPQARDWKGECGRGAKGLGVEDLPGFVKDFPTPTAHMSKEGGYPAEYTRRTVALTAMVMAKTVHPTNGKLNPDWVEFLMGWPTSWTDLTSTGVIQYPLSPEPEGLPRVCESTPARTPRLKCIGNGQVPQCAATAYQLLLERSNEAK